MFLWLLGQQKITNSLGSSMIPSNQGTRWGAPEKPKVMNSNTGKCLTPTQLLICSSFSRENGHLLLVCSSLSTSQVTTKLSKCFLLLVESIGHLFQFISMSLLIVCDVRNQLSTPHVPSKTNFAKGTSKNASPKQKKEHHLK